jgi:uncharacterized integral membrane protein
MRYLKVLALVVFFFFSMLFFVQNTAILSNDLSLKLDLFQLQLQTATFPFYLLILLAFVAGAFLTLAYFFLEKVRLSSKVRAGKAKIASLEKELEALRPALEKEEIEEAVEQTPVEGGETSTQEPVKKEK